MHSLHYNDKLTLEKVIISTLEKLDKLTPEKIINSLQNNNK